MVAFDRRLGLVDFFGRWRLPGGVNVGSAVTWGLLGRGGSGGRSSSSRVALWKSDTVIPTDSGSPCSGVGNGFWPSSPELVDLLIPTW